MTNYPEYSHSECGQPIPYPTKGPPFRSSPTVGGS